MKTDKVIEFLKSNSDLELAKSLLEVIEKENTRYIYWNEYVKGIEPYLIILTAINNIEVVPELIENIAKNMSYMVADALPITYLLDRFSREDQVRIREKVKELVEYFECDEREIVANSTRTRENITDLETCLDFPFEIIEVLEKINTPSAKAYIDLIHSNEILGKALEMIAFEFEKDIKESEGGIDKEIDQELEELLGENKDEI